ncbi:hypothetical protein GTY75_20200 [Streptomyces sp. SID8381]|uniref:hypothetical protein n=1 Tax=unclassified Streptomyces TaxID=2593676 RepID=UPI001319E831|nr:MULTISPECIES: hypothetical protein [unclassified Streptomyces]MYX28927.1 hypothetical protein [Streptomyces sp. SID8381]
MITLAGDDRDGSKTRDWEVEDPQLERIIRSIADLDGNRFTEISVTEDEPFRYLSVAGGPDLYLVTGESADGEILQLTEPDAGSEQIELVCGGQMGLFERSSLVTQDQAIGAVSEFLRGFPEGLVDAWSVE